MRLGVGTSVAYGGTEALYMRHERDVLRSLVGLAEAGVIERASALQQIGLLHAAKSMLGASILADDDPWRDPPTPLAASLPDPATNRVGKYHGPSAGAPDTQRRAAMLVYPTTGTARERVLALITERGVTDEEGCEALGMLMNTYRPRRNELLNDGWVMDGGDRRETGSGTDAVVWVLTPEAMTADRKSSAA